MISKANKDVAGDFPPSDMYSCHSVNKNIHWKYSVNKKFYSFFDVLNASFPSWDILAKEAQ